MRTAATAALLTTLLVTVSVSAQAPPPAPPGPAGAKAEDNPTGWTVKAGLSYVQTVGNSGTTNLGVRFNVSHNWTRTYFTLVGSGVRTDTTTLTRFGVGTGPDSYTLVELESKRKTAENYLLDASLDRTITDRFYWTTGAGWLRNTFAGIDSRENLRAGVGYVLSDAASKGTQFKTAILGTLTHQSETIPDPRTDDTFVGLRLMADLLVPFKSGSFNSRTDLDENLQSTDDFRWAWWNSLAVNINARLGLQVSWLLLYDNLPALTQVTIFPGQAGGVPVLPPLGSALVPLKKWDQEFAVSLVINIAPKKPTKVATGSP